MFLLVQNINILVGTDLWCDLIKAGSLALVNFLFVKFSCIDKECKRATSAYFRRNESDVASKLPRDLFANRQTQTNSVGVEFFGVVDSAELFEE